MANKKISELSTSTSYTPSTTYVPVVDTSDTSESATGSNYKVPLSQFAGGEVPSNFVFVEQASDLPTPVGSVITLAADTTYQFVANVDLTGDRLVASRDTTIIGTSSETCKISSTGLGTGVPLLTSEWNTQVRNITFLDVHTAIALDGTANNASFDWTGVNFENVASVGSLNNVDNFIFFNGAFLSSVGLRISGTAGTISFSSSLFVGNGSAASIIDIGGTANISRRFRIIYSSVVAFGATTGVTVNASATIPVEGFILDQLNFSGGGTYLSGISKTDVESRILECRGIENTAILGGCFFTGNTTATVINTVNTPVQIQGTSSEYAANQQFTHTSPITLRYDGAISRSFVVRATLSVRGATNNLQCTMYMSKNGSVVTNSAVEGRTANSTEAVNMSFQYITELNTNDEISLWIANNNNTQDFTVTSCSFIANAI